MKRIIQFWWPLSLLLWTTQAQADAGTSGAKCREPLQHRSQIPASAIFLELTPLAPCTLDSGIFRLEILGQGSNTSVIAPSRGLAAPRIITDHERWEQTLALRIGTEFRSDLGLMLRYVEDGAGNWDTFLRQYHKQIGLPYASRKIRKDGQYLYWLYNPETENWLLVQNPQRGWGDAVFSFRNELGSTKILATPIRWGWRAELKQPLRADLPTISSGNSDFGLGLSASTSGKIWGHPLAFWANLGAVRPGKPEHEIYPRKSAFFSGGTGIYTDISKTWNVAAQILSASARYQVPELVRGLNHRQTILALGLRHVSGTHQFTFGITEDLDYNSSEDISLLLGWKWGP